MEVTAQNRDSIIAQLERSFQAMPTWAKTAMKHAMDTHAGMEGTLTVRDGLERLNNEALGRFYEDVQDNGDLVA